MSRKLDRSPAASLARNGLPPFEAVVATILAYWSRANASDVEHGAKWYGDTSQAVLAALVALGIPSPAHAAALLSALSPRTSWARNVAGAYAYASGGPAAALALGCMRSNVDKATAVLSSDSPLDAFDAEGAPKTYRFARNLLGDDSVVTVDVWAARIALGNVEGINLETMLSRAGVYAAVEAAYIEAAYRAGVSPLTMQATTWIVARNGRHA